MTIKSAIITSVLAASLVTSVFAAETSTDMPLPQFTAADTQMLFDQSTQPVQLAALSQLEMKETEGAGGAFGFGISPAAAQQLRLRGIDLSAVMRQMTTLINIAGPVVAFGFLNNLLRLPILSFPVPISPKF